MKRENFLPTILIIILYQELLYIMLTKKQTPGCKMVDMLPVGSGLMF
jgi:hypothetical protein